MRIELYTFTFNDEKMLPYFLKKYDFVDCMTFIDSGSTDKTIKIINSIEKEHYIIETGLKIYDISVLTHFKNTIWQETNYDLVLFPDVDEIIPNSYLRSFFEISNADIYKCTGYEMVSDRFDLETTKKIRSTWYDKIIAFNPKIKIVFAEGSHSAVFNEGNVNNELSLFHYKYLGLDYLLERRQKTIDRNPKLYVKSKEILEYELTSMLNECS